MRQLNEIEIAVCRMQANLFEKSVDLCNLSSTTFVRRFMNSDDAKLFDNQTILIMSYQNESILENINDKYKESNTKQKYSYNIMHWVGYMYHALVCLYQLSSKSIYKFFPFNKIVNYYPAYHTYSIEDASERMMESINYKNKTKNEVGIDILRKENYTNKLKEMIGKEIFIYIDRPIGSTHEEYENIKYKQNYGHIKELKALDGEYQDAYLLGISKPIDKYKGVVIAIIERKNDDENKLVIAKKGATYSTPEIRKLTNFQEKFFNSRIIR